MANDIAVAPWRAAPARRRSLREFVVAGWHPYALLGIFCLCLYLPGIAAIPALDRDEARFAQATRQMLETHDFLDIRFQDEARNNKPAGIYWLQSAAVAAFSTPQSTAIWPYRLPSLLGAIGAVWLTFAFGATLLASARRALLAAALLAAALGLVAEAHIAKTDAALLAALVAGQGALGVCYMRARIRVTIRPALAAVFWCAEIAAIYLKGPIAPGLALITAATLSLADRDTSWLRGLRPALGLPAAALALLPWLYAMESATHGAFLAQSLGHDFLAKLIGAEESHGAPPLYYLALAYLTFWPGSLFLALAVISGWQRRDQRTPRFLMAWLVPAWILLELVPTKLPHYALPLYPALALLIASAVGRGTLNLRRERLIRAAGTAAWLVATVLIAAALIVLPVRLGPGLMPAAVAPAVVLLALAGWTIARRPGLRKRLAMLPVMALVLAPAAGTVVPHLDRLWLSRSAAALIAANPAPAGAVVTTIGYREPSLVFLLDRAVAFATADTAVAAGGEVLVNRRDSAAFDAQLAAQGLAARPLGSVSGIDYSTGETLTLTLYQVAPR